MVHIWLKWMRPGLPLSVKDWDRSMFQHWRNWLIYILMPISLTGVYYTCQLALDSKSLSTK